MTNMNHVELIGNLTKDVELRFTPNNKAVAQFTIATNYSYKDQAGAWVEGTPEYHEVIVWSSLGERCNQVLHKGDKVFVSGRLQTRSWEAQDGSKRYKTELVADTIIGPDLVNKGAGNRDGGASSEQPAPKASSRTSQPPASAPSPTSDDEINIDDIPF